ncbi:MAG: hypothetical protein IPL52_11560 [Flavobacteriales bacterium]|nr:hypothetical protein [Flavobacteriales bacterium]
MAIRWSWTRHEPPTSGNTRCPSCPAKAKCTSNTRDALRDRLPPINTHSDEFGYLATKGYGGYGHVYGKTATMLYNLQYVLGDSLFPAAMRDYFDRWKICHPYPEDFRQSIIDFTRSISTGSSTSGSRRTSASTAR